MLLPQLGAFPPAPGMSFSIANHAGWYDIIAFTQPNNPNAALDISGINFHAELRSAVDDASNRLDISSTDTPVGFVNGGVSGILYFAVDASLIMKLTPMVYVMDIIAIDIVSGVKKNLCEGGPCLVTVLMGVTR